jgi:hypothetical protein
MTNGFKIDDSRGFADFDPNTPPTISALYLDENGNETVSKNAVIARYINEDGSVNDIDLVKLRKFMADEFRQLDNA